MSPAPHSTESPGISVERSIVVNVPQARAFDVFVDMTYWWPLATHTIGEAPARASIIEPRAGQADRAGERRLSRELDGADLGELRVSAAEISAARAAGIQHASSATAISTAETPANVAGSAGETS